MKSSQFPSSSSGCSSLTESSITTQLFILMPSYFGWTQLTQIEELKKTMKLDAIQSMSLGYFDITVTSYEIDTGTGVKQSQIRFFDVTSYLTSLCKLFKRCGSRQYPVLLITIIGSLIVALFSAFCQFLNILERQPNQQLTVIKFFLPVESARSIFILLKTRLKSKLAIPSSQL